MILVLGGVRTNRTVLFFGVLGFFAHCKPSIDTRLRDIERNYVDEGFLDEHTFQIKCERVRATQKLENCQSKLSAALLTFKEKYELSRVNSNLFSDIEPDSGKTESARLKNEGQRSERDKKINEYMAGYVRVVFEYLLDDDFYQVIYRLRRKNAIYFMQKELE